MYTWKVEEAEFTQTSCSVVRFIHKLLTLPVRSVPLLSTLPQSASVRLRDYQNRYYDGAQHLASLFFFFHVNPLVHVYGASSLLSLQPLFTCWLPMIAQFDAHRAFSFVYFCSPFFTHASLQHKTLLLWLYAELHNYSTRFFLVMFSQEKKKAKYQLLCSHNNITTPSFSRFLPLYHLFVKTNKKHNCFFFFAFFCLTRRLHSSLQTYSLEIAALFPSLFVSSLVVQQDDPPRWGSQEGDRAERSCRSLRFKL